VPAAPDAFAAAVLDAPVTTRPPHPPSERSDWTGPHGVAV